MRHYKLGYWLALILFISLSAQLTGNRVIQFVPEELRSEQVHINEFLRVSPRDSKPIHLDTDIWLWRDQSNLYVRWEAKIDDTFNPGKFNNRDECDECDFLSLQLITGPNNHYAYYYQALPYGNKYDGIRRSDMSIDLAWNSNYNYTNTITDKLWTCQMTIPFKDLRYSGKPPYKWKLIVTRYLCKQEHYYSYPLVTTNMGLDYFRSAANVVIDERPKRSLKPHIDAYALGRLAVRLLESSHEDDPDEGSGIEPGFDSSINISSSSKVKLSLNPDFSDLPLDIDEYRYNVNFWPVYPEKRPFFTEDIDIFDLNPNLFESRNIHQPLFGLNFTGATKVLSYGIMAAKDRRHVYHDKTIDEDIYGHEAYSYDSHVIEDDLYGIISAKAKWNKNSVHLALLNQVSDDYQAIGVQIKPVVYLYKNNFIWLEQSFLDCGPQTRIGAEFNILDLKIDAEYNKGDFNFADNLWDADSQQIRSTAIFSRVISRKFLHAYQLNLQYNNITEDGWKMSYLGGGFQLTFPIKLSLGINLYPDEKIYKDSIFLYFYPFKWLKPKLYLESNFRTFLTYQYEEKQINKSTYGITVSGILSKNIAYLLSSETYSQEIDDYIGDKGSDWDYFCERASRNRLGLKINLSNTLSFAPTIDRQVIENEFEEVRSAQTRFLFDFIYEFKKDCFLRVGAKDSFGFNHCKPYLYVKANYSF